MQMQLEHYQGVEDGESWSEGSLSSEKYFAALKPGTYSLRLETFRDASKPAPRLDVRVTEGVFSPTGCVLLFGVIILLTVPVFFSWSRHRGPTDASRWTDSMFTPQGEPNDD